MRTRPSRNAVALSVAVALLSGVVGAQAQEQPSTTIDEAGWQGVLGVRAPVSTAQRYVVLRKPPSLAARVPANGGEATEAEMAGWSAAAVAQQEQFLARLSAVGARIAPEYRYTKVVNGFSDLIIEVWGDAGHHARSAPGQGPSPLNVPIIVDAIVAVSG